MAKEPTMLTAALRWAPGLLAIFVLGPIAGALVGMLRGPDGGPDASLLVNTSPVLGLGALIGVFVIAGVSGLIASRIVGYRLATWAAGYVLAWAAYRSADVPNLIRSQAEGAPWIALAIEGLLCAVLAAGLLIAMLKCSNDRSAKLGSGDSVGAALRAPSTWAGLAAAVIAGGVVAHLVNMDPIKGQAIFAAVIAGVAAGGAGAYISSFVGETPGEPILAVGFCLLAVLGPIAGMALYGSDGALKAANEGHLLGPSAMLGLDWAAGLFMGLPAGVALVESTVEQTAKATA